jgi:thiol reductant ABC exporter CydC subunit
VLAGVLLGFAASCTAVALIATATWLVARAAEGAALVALTAAIVAVRVLGVGRGVLRYCERLVGHDAAFRVMARTRVQVYIDLERAAPAGLGRVHGGDVLTRVVSDVEAIQDLLVRAFLPIGVAALTSVAATAWLATVLPSAAVILALGLFVGGVVAPYVGRLTARWADRRMAGARGALNRSVVEVLRGLADLAAHRATGRWLDRLEREDRELTEIARRTAASSGAAAALATLAAGLTVVGQLLIGAAAADDGRLSSTMVPVLALAALAVFDVTTPLPVAAHYLAHGMRAVARLRALSELPRPALTEGHLPAPIGPLSLEARGLTVQWPGNTAPTLYDVDLTLRPGQRIAVVGESGAGKSTLVAALLGFLPPASGSVALVGRGHMRVDLADLEDDERRRAITACTQDAHMFDTTIRANLLLGRPDATDEELEEALRKVRMWAWVCRLPHGLDTPVGERGVRLSGGERQRLALARALLADPPILLLDEPTAHVDDVTATVLMRDLLVATQGRTTLLVTHRLAGLSVVDEIIVLAGGRVVQRGAPTKLIQSEGPYRRMWLRSAAKDTPSESAPTMQMSFLQRQTHSSLTPPFPTTGQESHPHEGR